MKTFEEIKTEMFTTMNEKASRRMADMVADFTDKADKASNVDEVKVDDEAKDSEQAE